MARGTEAKQKVIAKIKEVFGDDFIGEANNKYYVYSTEAGEKIQIAISLTCPKTPVVLEGVPSFDGGFDFSAPPVAKPEPVTEIKQKELDNVQALMERLGL